MRLKSKLSRVRVETPNLEGLPFVFVKGMTIGSERKLATMYRDHIDEEGNVPLEIHMAARIIACTEDEQGEPLADPEDLDLVVSSLDATTARNIYKASVDLSPLPSLEPEEKKSEF